MNRKTDEELLKEIQKHTLGMEDTFSFECKQCGDCCRKRSQPVLLTGYDVYNVAKELNVGTAEVLMKYCNIIPGDTSGLPVVYLRERPDGSCSLLRKGLCTVQHNKPVVCRIFPIGRYYDGKEHRYFTQWQGSCVGTGQREITLKEWLDAFGVQELDEASEIWGKFIIAASLYGQKIRAKADREKYAEYFRDVGMALYVWYDMHLSVEDNMKRNIQKIEDKYKGFKVQ